MESSTTSKTYTNYVPNPPNYPPNRQAPVRIDISKCSLLRKKVPLRFAHILPNNNASPHIHFNSSPMELTNGARQWSSLMKLTNRASLLDPEWFFKILAQQQCTGGTLDGIFYTVWSRSSNT